MPPTVEPEILQPGKNYSDNKISTSKAPLFLTDFFPFPYSKLIWLPEMYGYKYNGLLYHELPNVK